MAAPVCCLRTVLSQCQRHALRRTGYVNPSFTCTNRTWAAARFYAAPAAARMTKKVKDDQKVKEKETKEEIEQKRKDTTRPKPYGLTAWEPVDDVYIARYYPKPTLDIETAIEMLKTFQTLDFTYLKQPVYIELKLDMKLEKKKKVDPFVGHVHYPYPFASEVNRVLVFTESAEFAQIAQDNGAAVVGGSELIQKILDDEIEVDFYVATPEILPKLNVLKSKLRKKFPKSKRGSVGVDIPKMLELFKTGTEYLVEKECLVQTKIATLDMPSEHIIANLDSLIKNVSTYKPLSYGPFVERVIISSATSEALFIKFQQFLPKEEPETAKTN
ncbi:39S ribosomal protein L1, mitochondrial isoform X1 [Bombina bombina]|uniref:39S ribosomal protein L1, mitochondrial isoform X1 n=1 Tax=Bombina bombina TaxID=8345 RepID=UPI00235B0F64|nr:39S ribosomal protein L1, mitochondrial isoform X1 [Bombina bombina]